MIYINNCPKRCNTKQSIYYSASSLYMFRVSTTPVIRNTQNCNYSLRYWSCCAAAAFQRRYAWPRWREAAAQKIWPVPEAVVTILCTPDDGCGWQPKHVEWTWRIINRLFCVASRWAITNIVASVFVKFHILEFPYSMSIFGYRLPPYKHSTQLTLIIKYGASTISCTLSTWNTVLLQSHAY